MRSALSKGLNRVVVSFPSLEDGNRHSFQNVMFYSYLESQMVDKVHKLIDSECCTPSSEPFKFCNRFMLTQNPNLI
jgi:hypothetical protein